MFRRLELPVAEQSRELTITVEGRRVSARDGETVATALLNAGVVPFRRTPISEEPRAPLCLMGVCFECLVEVDGVQNVQACMVQVRGGMAIFLQKGARRVERP